MLATGSCLFSFSRLACLVRRPSREVSEQFFVNQEMLWWEIPLPSFFRRSSSIHPPFALPDVPTCWSMASFKITLVELQVHLRWQVRFADIAHSLKFREVLTCYKKKTNCRSFLAEEGNFGLFHFYILTCFFGLFGAGCIEVKMWRHVLHSSFSVPTSVTIVFMRWFLLLQNWIDGFVYLQVEN